MQSRSQLLKSCDKCGKPAEQQAGVVMRGKWYCGNCWIKWANGR